MKMPNVGRPGKFVIAAAAAVAAAGLGTGVAVAQSSANHGVTAKHVTTRTAVDEPTSPDTDTLQQGDQTAPDTVTAPQRAAVHAKVAAAHAVRHSSVRHSSARMQTKSDEPGENKGENNENAPSDGPGGHEDPAGDVQHEGGANEQ
jgi:hypothetical protein